MEIGDNIRGDIRTQHDVVIVPVADAEYIRCNAATSKAAQEHIGHRRCAQMRRAIVLQPLSYAVVFQRTESTPVMLRLKSGVKYQRIESR